MSGNNKDTKKMGRYEWGDKFFFSGCVLYKNRRGVIVPG